MTRSNLKNAPHETQRGSQKGPLGGLVACFVASVSALLLLPGAVADGHWEFEGPEMIFEGLDWPVDLAFGRDGYLYFPLLQEGVVMRASLEDRTIDEDFVVEFPDADWQSGTETGFHSIALDPEFHANGIFYASYMTNEDGNWTNILARVTLLDESGGADIEVLLERPGLEFHNGGRLMVADGHLWWTTGDNIHWQANPEEARVAQEDGNLIGKILRLNMDGGPAEGNPWDDHAYTKGHRNVFGIAWDPENERALITENADAGSDYIQILESGANYGWPDCEGFCDEPQEAFTDPIWQADSNIAPTGATWFRGAFWFGSFNQGDLYRAEDAQGEWNVENVHHHASDNPRVLGVTNGPDENSIWYSTTSQIMRLGFHDHEDHPAQGPMEEGPYWWEQDHIDPVNGKDDGATVGAGAPALIPGAMALLILVWSTRKWRSRLYDRSG